MGGAACARPDYRRMMSASDRRCLAPPGVYPRPDCSGRDQDRPREWVWRGPARTLRRPLPASHVRHRPAPVSAPRHLPCGWHGTTRPGGWLCTVDPTARQRNPDGLRLPPVLAARYDRSRKAFLPHGRTRSRTIRQRERERHEYCIGVAGGEKVTRSYYSHALNTHPK
ncbi:hypothetical protein IMCC20628_04373 [Hoeflea sp. IMCC20628]|nr:hypothetical protein IMCC20628_04373 [Hoeflea sp. IMCC20628]